MDIIGKINDLKEELSFFEEEIEKYEYIIELGKNSKPIEEKYKTDDNIIRGCTSKLWLIAKEEKGILSFESDSDTVIVRGLAQIVQSIFSDETAKNIVEFEIDILKSLELKQIITPSRQNGVGNMIKKIQKFAKEKI